MDKVEVGQVFLRVLPVSINAPHSSLSTRCCYRKDKWANAGGLPKRQCSFGNRGEGGGALDRKVLSTFLGFRDKVALRQGSSLITSASPVTIIPQMLHIPLYLALIRTNGRGLGPFRKTKLSQESSPGYCFRLKRLSCFITFFWEDDFVLPPKATLPDVHPIP